MADKTMTKILIFGGNGFMGGETVVELLALNTFDITVVNRGNWQNYDSKIRIRPFVKTINIDRCEYREMLLADRQLSLQKRSFEKWIH